MQLIEVLLSAPAVQSMIAHSTSQLENMVLIILNMRFLAESENVEKFGMSKNAIADIITNKI